MINTVDASLAPNYGSYFGVPQLNYEDVPVPKITVDYIRESLDPYAHPTAYLSTYPVLPPEQAAERQRIFGERLSRYAQAGVKYVLAISPPGSDPAFAIRSDSVPVVMSTGQWIEILAETKPGAVAAVAIQLATLDSTSNGRLKVTFCAAAVCAEGIADLAYALDNKHLLVTLDRPVPVERQYTLRVEKLDGSRAVAVWMFQSASATVDARITGTAVTSATPSARTSASPRVGDPLPVYRGRSMNVYELRDTRPFFSADACTLQTVSHDRVAASCPQPSRLVRLVAAMRGWSATVNAAPVPIAISDGVFQAVDLPAGLSQVTFAYAPAGFRPAMAAAGAALLLVFAILVVSLRDAARRRWQVRRPRGARAA